jgi:hypothetical protein
MTLLKLVSSRSKVKKGTKPGSHFDITQRAVIEDGIPTIRRWKNGSPFMTDKEELAVIAKFEKTIAEHWDKPKPKIQDKSFA